MIKTLKLLNRKGLSSFWVAQSISMMANAFHLIALPLWILQMTNSPVLASMVAFVELASMLVFSTFFGVIVDVFRRKKLLIIGDLIRGLLTLALLFVASESEMWIVYISAFGVGTMSALFGPAQVAIVRQSVTIDDLPNVNSLFQLSFSLSLIIGPLLGGTLLNLVGFKLTFIINSITFFIGALGSLLISDLSERKIIQRSFLVHVFVDLKEGLNFIISHGIIKRIMFTQVVVFFFTGANGFLFITHFNFVNLDERLIGIFMTSQGIGMVVGSLIIPRLIKKLSSKFALLYLLVIAMGGTNSLFIFNVPNSNILAIVFIIVFGISLSSFNILTNSVLQSETPGTHIGKVTAFSRMLNRTSMAVVTALAGLLVSVISSQKITMFAGIILMVLGIITLINLVVFRQENHKKSHELLSKAE